MSTLRAFSTKAEKYARYRWSYAPQAVDAFCQAAGLGAQSSVADLGAGTGILTRQLAGRVGQVCGIEPNPEMMREAQKYLAGSPNCILLAATAEATGLPAGSVDAISVAEAAHWFDFNPGQTWGTIIAHQSISTHFIYNYLHNSDKAKRYADLFMTLLSALEVHGSLYYAPGVPFFEDELAELGQYEISRFSVAVNTFGIGEIAYSVRIQRIEY